MKGDAPRIVVVGAGLVGRKHAALVARNACLAAIVDPDPAAKALASELGAPHFASLDDCLSERAPDGAIVATPNRLHVEHGLACVRAGVPTLVEKPIADRADSAAHLVQEAERAGVPLLVGHHRRHNPLIARAKETIESGRLGRLTLVDASFWLYKPDDYFEQDWRRKPGAGPVFINLIHDIDLLRHLCGEIAVVRAVEASAARGHEVEDTAVVLLEFENGALGTVSISDATVAPWSWEMTAGENPAYPHVEAGAYRIGGTHGALSLPDLRLWRHPGQRSWWSPIEAERLTFEPADPLVRQIQHFADVIAGRAAPLVDGREGLASLAAVEAIKRAATTGEPVRPDARPSCGASSG